MPGASATAFVLSTQWRTFPGCPPVFQAGVFQFDVFQTCSTSTGGAGGAGQYRKLITMIDVTRVRDCLG